VRTADCAILPFPDIDWWRVSSPIKLMEYLAIGVPVVATAIDAHRYIANENGGIVLAADSEPSSLANAIREVFDTTQVPANVGLLQQSISWDKQAKNLADYLVEIKLTKAIEK